MANLDQQIASLEAMGSAELKDMWRRLTASPLPRISPSLLRLALAWEIQARAMGGLSRATTAKLDQLAGGKTKTASPTAGTRLVREWGGKVHVVTIGEDKVIRWDDRSWNSLSEVARLWPLRQLRHRRQRARSDHWPLYWQQLLRRAGAGRQGHAHHQGDLRARVERALSEQIPRCFPDWLTAIFPT